MPHIIYGQPLADAILARVATYVATLKTQGIQPSLGVILVGSDGPSRTYVGKKGEAAKAVGIDFTLHQFDDTITTEALVANIARIQEVPNLSGLIVQLPLPKHIDTSAVLNAIDETRDIDCLTNRSLGKLVSSTSRFLPPTISAILTILESEHISIAGKEITIVGAGPLVGKPLAIMLMNMNATITVCNSATGDLAEHTRHSDIVVTGVGKKHLITPDMIKPGALVIDAGVDILDGKSYGDTDATAMAAIATVTATPGGVGPITVAKLLENTLIAAQPL